MERSGPNYYIHAIFQDYKDETVYYIRVSPDLNDSLTAYQIGPNKPTHTYESVFIGSLIGQIGLGFGS